RPARRPPRPVTRRARRSGRDATVTRGVTPRSGRDAAVTGASRGARTVAESTPRVSSQRWRDGFRGIPWEAVRTLRLPGRATVIVAALGVALLLTSLGGAVVYAYTGDIPRGTTVLG